MPRDEVRVRGTCDRERAERAVDVQPQTLARTDVRERAERIERAGVDAAGSTDDQERAVSGGAVGRDARAQRTFVHREPLADRDEPQRGGAEPRDPQRLGHGVVHARGRIGRQPRAADSAFACAFAQRRVARGDDRQQIPHRRAAREDAARIRRKPEQLREPRDDRALDVHRRVLAAAHVRVHPRGEQLGQHACRVARAVHPAEETRMLVAGGIRADQLVEARDGRFERFAAARQRLAQRRFHRVGHGTPRGLFAHGGKIVDDAVDRGVERAPELLPVHGIERSVVHARSRARGGPRSGGAPSRRAR